MERTHQANSSSGTPIRYLNNDEEDQSLAGKSQDNKAIRPLTTRELKAKQKFQNRMMLGGLLVAVLGLALGGGALAIHFGGGFSNFGHMMSGLMAKKMSVGMAVGITSGALIAGVVMGVLGNKYGPKAMKKVDEKLKDFREYLNKGKSDADKQGRGNGIVRDLNQAEQGEDDGSSDNDEIHRN